MKEVTTSRPVLTLRPDLAAKRSGATDYGALCREFGVPLHGVANINDQGSLELLRGADLDVAFVIGWTQIVQSPALRLTRIGMIGADASLLPHNRGRAPINWTLMRGEKQTGNSLIWLAEGVDRGNIIDQTLIPITPYDTCDSLYHQVAASNRDMILRVLPQLMVGKRPRRPQPHTDEAELPGRRPEDGLLDWSKPHLDVYDFVRALTRPYPGAFSRLDGKRWTLWRLCRACLRPTCPKPSLEKSWAQCSAPRRPLVGKWLHVAGVPSSFWRSRMRTARFSKGRA